MLVTEVPGTPDSTLPLIVPPLPNPLDRRWIADTIAADGSVASITDISSTAATMVQATGGAQPIAGTVDSLRAITFDGTDDMLGTGPSLLGQTEFSMYAVVKIPTLPSATKVLYTASGSYIGLTSSNRFTAAASANAALAPTVIAANTWYVVGMSVKVVGSGTSEARMVTSLDPTGVSSTTATFAAFAATSIGGTSGLWVGMVAREWGLKIGTAHTIAQLQANVAALKLEYGIA